jgi:dihydroorotate dehydrogenase (NAD+) catalytic subunit
MSGDAPANPADAGTSRTTSSKAGRRPDLEARLGPVSLPNPVLTASGTFGYGDEEPELTGVAGLGGIVTKTVTLEPRAGNAPPRIWETPAGMLNSIGLQNVGVDRFLTEKLPALASLGIPVIVSVGGRRAEEYVETVRRLDGAPGITAFEINVSCPNVKEGGLEFCQVPSAAAGVVEAIRNVTRLPLWAKLSPNVTSLGTVARAVSEAGADGVTVANTFVGLCVDIRTRRSRLSAGTGGLSGPAIRPLALARVREAVRAVTIPVVGCGGITTAEDALEFLVVGARAVQVGTASFRDPRAARSVVEGIEAFLRAEGLASVEALIGTYLEGA